jgi:hypothetical protein
MTAQDRWAFSTISIHPTFAEIPDTSVMKSSCKSFCGRTSVQDCKHEKPTSNMILGQFHPLLSLTIYFLMTHLHAIFQFPSWSPKQLLPKVFPPKFCFQYISPHQAARTTHHNHHSLP